MLCMWDDFVNKRNEIGISKRYEILPMWMSDTLELQMIKTLTCQFCTQQFSTDRIRKYCTRKCMNHASYRRNWAHSQKNDKIAPRLRNAQKHKIRITPENVKLYCKISQIIRGVECKNPELIIKQQDNGRWNIETFP